MQPRDRLKGQPQEGQHSAADFGGTPDRLPPARGRDRSRTAETLRGSVHESPVRRSRTRLETPCHRLRGDVGETSP